jgi:hypothetical protein
MRSEMPQSTGIISSVVTSVPAFATQYLQQGWQMEQEARAKASKIQQQLAR